MVNEQGANWDSSLNKSQGAKKRLVVVYDSSGKVQNVGPVLDNSDGRADVPLSPGEKLIELELPYALEGESMLEIWRWMKAAGLDDIGESRPPA